MFRWLNGCRGPRLLLVLACASSCHWTVAAAQARRDSTATLVVQVMDTAEAPVPLADVILPFRTKSTIKRQNNIGRSPESRTGNECDGAFPRDPTWGARTRTRSA